ncbi:MULTISPECIES: hypothetical protein [Streptomyces]|uniref:hypothetical protein n=1 Tax=Streptomyces TaxID=1883 RepID=UPI0022499888|nr:hypothetical protein [Streptomyces sp. JHD 1]MCX2967763.1 hypothetical protein [Streptomyces sp. JHD 1]
MRRHVAGRVSVTRRESGYDSYHSYHSYGASGAGSRREAGAQPSGVAPARGGKAPHAPAGTCAPVAGSGAVADAAHRGVA